MSGKGKVTGLGGVFFRSKDPKATKEWYANHLGISMDDYGHTFTWRDEEDPDKKCLTQWSPMAEDTDYYDPGNQEFMINYRVEHLDDLLETLKTKGVKQIGKVERYDYGNFAWVIDADGRKIELWEPVDGPLL